MPTSGKLPETLSGYDLLAANILRKAISDVLSAKRLSERLDAICFLLGEAARDYCTYLGLPDDAPLAWLLRSAAVREAKVRGDALVFWEGLSKRQARLLSQKVLDVLPKLRREVLQESENWGMEELPSRSAGGAGRLRGEPCRPFSCRTAEGAGAIGQDESR